jgi:hypothetical protein
MASVALEIDGLRSRYGTVTALDGLSFDVPPVRRFFRASPNACSTRMTAVH